MGMNALHTFSHTSSLDPEREGSWKAGLFMTLMKVKHIFRRHFLVVNLGQSSR